MSKKSAGQIHAEEMPQHFSLEIHRAFDLDKQEWVGGTVENPTAFWGKTGPPPLPPAVPPLIELALGRRVNAPINDKVALAWVEMTDERLKATMKAEEELEDELPSVCDTCLGPNPYVKMVKHKDDSECKICSEVFTMFRWKPDTIDMRLKVRWKKTIICTPCAKAKNVCQTCLFDLELALPVEIRDTLLEKGKDAFLPEKLQQLLPSVPGGDASASLGMQGNLKMLQNDLKNANNWDMRGLPSTEKQSADKEGEESEEMGNDSEEEEQGARPELIPGAGVGGGGRPQQQHPSRAILPPASTRAPPQLAGTHARALPPPHHQAALVAQRTDDADDGGDGEGGGEEPTSVRQPPSKGGGKYAPEIAGGAHAGRGAVVARAPDRRGSQLAVQPQPSQLQPLQPLLDPVERSKAQLTSELLAPRGWQRQYQQNRAKICSFWMAGECQNGLACPFRHEKPTYYEARDMGLIKGVKGSNPEQTIIQRYYGEKDVVAKSMLREVSQRAPGLLDQAGWPSRKDKARQKAIKASGADQKEKPKLRLAGVFEPGKPATMVATWSKDKGMPDSEALRRLFEASGEVLSLRMVPHRGMAFVKFKEIRGAHAAYRSVGKGYMLNGISVACSPHLPVST